MNLTEMHSLVHVQTQTTSGDLADQTIDSYLQQGFERTIHGETQWPFYETSWDLALEPDAATLSLPGDVNPPGIMALYDLTNGFRLMQVAPEFGDDHYGGAQVGTTWPVQFSQWGDKLYLYPSVQASAESRPYRLRGYRRPVTWLTPANDPDCDPRLHVAITHYACALAYAQQEDETLESVYMDRWQRDAEMARKAIMDVRHHKPLVYQGSTEGVPGSAIQWVLTPP